jgi:hypothetical protein
MKRQAFESILTLAWQSAPEMEAGRKWAERVSKT